MQKKCNSFKIFSFYLLLLFFIAFQRPNPSFASCLDRDSITLKNTIESFKVILTSLKKINEKQKTCSNIEKDDDISNQKKLILINWIKILEECRHDMENKLYINLIEALKKMRTPLPAGSCYDAIIVGGGLSGTNAAVTLGDNYNVLVLDKNTWPSAFGSGPFYLNTTRSSRMSRSTMSITEKYKVRSPIVDFATSHSSLGYVDAASISKNLLSDLFLSMADVALDTEVRKISDIKSDREHNTPKYEVETNRGKFCGRYLLMSTGRQGVNLSRFDQETQELVRNELNDPHSNLYTVEGFLSKLREDSGPVGPAHFRPHLKGKKIAIIGTNDGAGAVFTNILGIDPQSAVRNFTLETEDKTTFLFDNQYYEFKNSGTTISLYGGEKNSFNSDAKLHAKIWKKISADPSIKFDNSKNYNKSISKKNGKYYFNKGETQEGPFDIVIAATGYEEYFSKLFGDKTPWKDPKNGIYLAGGSTFFQILA